MKQFLPILEWLPKYRREYIAGDVSAGLTVGVMLIPQGMAYAMIAGLPPVYGLYAALVPQLVYAILGTSRQLAVGPVAMDSILVAAGISGMALSGTAEYIQLAILLALMMGGLQVIFGLARLGFLVNFLSKPVISGFTSAAALIIGLSQLKHLIGVDLGRNNSIFVILYEAGEAFAEYNWISILIGLTGIILIKGLKKVNKSIPGALVVVFLGIVSVFLWQLDQYGVKILGKIPSGLPSFALPDWNNPHIFELLPIALTLSLIAFMEAISVSKAIQLRHKGEYEIQPNQEMLAIGLGNVLGSLFGSYPTTGGFSRSAVNDQAGAKTNLAAVISASLIALVLLFFTPLFFYLPKAILASVIMVAVFGLINTQYPLYLWKVQKQEFAMLLVTFVSTLGLGIMSGIGVGVAVSLVLLIYRTAEPHYAVLAKIKNSKEYRNINRFEEVEIRPDVLVFRYDAPLYYANANHFVQSISREVDKKGEALKLIVLNAESTPFIDTTALFELNELRQAWEGRGIQLMFASVIGPVRDFMTRTELIQKMGREAFFTNIQDALDYYDEKPDALENTRFNISTQSNEKNSLGMERPV